MRSIDERCAAVRGRARRLSRRANGQAAVVVAVLALFSLIDLAGRSATDAAAEAMDPAEALFGAASLFGPSIGGYVLVGLVVAVVAVVVTLICMARRRSNAEQDRLPHEETSEGNAHER